MELTPKTREALYAAMMALADSTGLSEAERAPVRELVVRLIAELELRKSDPASLLQSVAATPSQSAADNVLRSVAATLLRAGAGAPSQTKSDSILQPIPEISSQAKATNIPEPNTAIPPQPDVAAPPQPEVPNPPPNPPDTAV